MACVICLDKRLRGGRLDKHMACVICLDERLRSRRCQRASVKTTLQSGQHSRGGFGPALLNRFSSAGPFGGSVPGSSVDCLGGWWGRH
eukprot:8270068-Pyramimonas_sp.AAC.1